MCPKIFSLLTPIQPKSEVWSNGVRVSGHTSGHDTGYSVGTRTVISTRTGRHIYSPEDPISLLQSLYVFLLDNSRSGKWEETNVHSFDPESLFSERVPWTKLPPFGSRP